MSNQEERFDGLFMTAIQQSNGIDNFFNNLFSFMRRKTDFFTFDDKSKDIVNKALTEHLKIFKEDKQREALIKQKQEQEKKKREQEEAMKRKQGESTATVEEVTEEEANRIQQEEAKKKAQLQNEGQNQADEEDKQMDSENDQDKEKKDLQVPLPGNGGYTDKYRWQQTLEEITMQVQVPDNIVAKELDVQIKGKTLKIGLKGKEPIINGELHKKIKPDDSLWTLEKDGAKRSLQITLAKYDNMSWWSCVLEGDPKIDTQKIEPENSKLSDLDGETRATVEKMMFDQQQKQKGLPTSDEMEKKNKLKAFMDAHPEMDFSKAKFC